MSTEPNSLRKTKFFGPTVGTGLLLLIMTIGLVVLGSDNIFAIGFGWLTFLIGIILVLMGTLRNQPIRNWNMAPSLRKLLDSE